MSTSTYMREFALECILLAILIQPWTVQLWKCLSKCLSQNPYSLSSTSKSMSGLVRSTLILCLASLAHRLKSRSADGNPVL
jgi:hypothetical protein